MRTAVSTTMSFAANAISIQNVQDIFTIQNLVLSKKLIFLFRFPPRSYILFFFAAFLRFVFLTYLYILFFRFIVFMSLFFFVLIFFNVYFLSISFHGHMSDADSAKGGESLRIDAQLSSNKTG